MHRSPIERTNWRRSIHLSLRKKSPEKAIKLKLAFKSNWKIHQEVESCVHGSTSTRAQQSSILSGTPLCHCEVLPQPDTHTAGSWIAPQQKADKFNYRCQIKTNGVICGPALGMKPRSTRSRCLLGNFCSLKHSEGESYGLVGGP